MHAVNVNATMTMQAVVTAEPGNLAQVEVGAPQPGPGEVLVRVRAATVNPVDLQTVDGMYHELGWVTTPRPTGLGWDVAGTVVAVGDGVTPALAPGARVAGLHEGVDKTLGTYAELVALPAGAVAPVPDGLDLEAAATVPLNALTASQALDLLGEADGRRLLVTGAAGAVGGYAAALAVERGWQVTGLARAGDADFVASTGAEPVTEVTERFPAVFDTAVLANVGDVADGGHYVGVMPPAVPDSERGVRTEAVLVGPDGEALVDLLARAADGRLATRIHRVLPLAEAAAAQQLLRAGGLRGRVVLRP